MWNSFSKIVVIGHGNVGSHMVEWLRANQIKPAQVFSRSFAGTKKKVLYVNKLADIIRDADLYILALPDDVVATVLQEMEPGSGLWVHCSASLGLDVFPPAFSRCAVFYPLQTFSKGVEMNYDLIPLLIEAKNEADLVLLKQLGMRMSNSVSNCTQEERLVLHIAAVFACNFSNHIMRLSADYLKAEKLDFEYLEPLVIQTLSKVIMSSPAESQTGPALRRDFGTIEKHLAKLENYPELKALYKTLTDSIISHNPPKNVEL